MKKKIFTLFDKKLNTYNPTTVYGISDVEVKRMLTAELRKSDGSSLIAQFPSDYDLMLLGEFDDAVGIVSAPPVKICCLDELL